MNHQSSRSSWFNKKKNLEKSFPIVTLFKHNTSHYMCSIYSHMWQLPFIFFLIKFTTCEYKTFTKEMKLVDFIELRQRTSTMNHQQPFSRKILLEFAIKLFLPLAQISIVKFDAKNIFILKIAHLWTNELNNSFV